MKKVLKTTAFAALVVASLASSSASTHGRQKYGNNAMVIDDGQVLVSDELRGVVGSANNQDKFVDNTKAIDSFNTKHDIDIESDDECHEPKFRHHETKSWGRRGYDHGPDCGCGCREEVLVEDVRRGGDREYHDGAGFLPNINLGNARVDLPIAERGFRDHGYEGGRDYERDREVDGRWGDNSGYEGDGRGAGFLSKRNSVKERECEGDRFIAGRSADGFAKRRAGRDFELHGFEAQKTVKKIDAKDKFCDEGCMGVKDRECAEGDHRRSKEFGAFNEERAAWRPVAKKVLVKEDDCGCGFE